MRGRDGYQSRRKAGAAVITAAVVLFSSPGQLRAQSGNIQPAAAERRRGEVIVELTPTASIDDVNARHNTVTIQRIYGSNFYRLRIPEGRNEKKWRKRLGKDVDVLSASFNTVVASPLNVFGRSHQSFPDGYVELGHTRNEYLSQVQLADLLNLPDAQIRSMGKGVVVAVIDTGIDRSHPDLAGRLWSDLRDTGDKPGDNIDNDGDGLVDDSFGWDFADNDNNPGESAGDPTETVAGHGTFIAGLIALVAPECQIMPVRAFYPDGTSDAFTVAQAIKYSADHGASVINLSFGSPEATQVMVDAIDYAHQKGAVLVAAVGNDNSESNPQYPATSLNALAVAAIDLASHKAQFSNFGSEVDVDAPGLRITSTYPSGDDGAPGYAVWSGTSFAAPFAAAEAALILALERRLDARTVIEQTATSIDDNNPGFAGKLGKGRIDLYRAAESVFFGQTGQGTHTSTRLISPTGIGPSGSAEISVEGAKQELRIGAFGLKAHSGYRIAVNGVDLGFRVEAVSLGGFRIEFSNETSAPFPLPEFLNPVTNARQIEVREISGTRVLFGDFAKPADPVKPVDQVDEKQAALVSTGLLPRAGGVARVEVDSEREKFRVEASGLEPNAIYQLVVDSRSFGPIVATGPASQTGSSFVRLEFTSDGSNGRPFPPGSGSALNFGRVEIKDSFGRAVLVGNFQATANPVGGGGGDDGFTPGTTLSLRGVIQQLPQNTLIGEWTVADKLIRVTAATRIKQEKGVVRVGAYVEVKGIYQADQSIAATEIEVKLISANATAGSVGVSGGTGGNGGGNR
jgi:hypothetical protein